MSKPAAKVECRGLKCDAPGCDFRDDAAIPHESLIGKPCPKCGANLLTEADMANVRLIQFVAHSINAAVGPVADDAEMGHIRFNMDGTGKLATD